MKVEEIGKVLVKRYLGKLAVRGVLGAIILEIPLVARKSRLRIVLELRDLSPDYMYNFLQPFETFSYGSLLGSSECRPTH